MLIARTNKAEVIRRSDSEVVKRYFTENAPARAEQDRLSLQSINRLFGCVHRDGWQYRIVQLLWFDIQQGVVCMELVPGSVLAELPKDQLSAAEFHAGAWLALYHNKMLSDKPDGLIYTDFTIHNLLVSLEQKTVVAIDPGMAWQHITGCGYEDVIKHIHSALVGLIVKKAVSPAILGSFLSGYESALSEPRSMKFYYRGLRREMWRLLCDYRNKSLFKCFVFIMSLMALLPLYMVCLPGYLLVIRRTAR